MDYGGWGLMKDYQTDVPSFPSHLTHYHKPYNNGGWLGPNRFVVTKVSIYDDAMKDVKTFRIDFIDKSETGPCMHQGVMVPISNSMIHDMNDDTKVLQMVAEQAAGYVKDDSFAEAVYQWWKAKNDPYAHHEWKVVGHTKDEIKLTYEYWQDDYKALYESKPAQVGPNMADVHSLPGLLEIVKHPPLIEGDKHPECEYVGGEYNLKWNIIHLNDMHRWTRERIADWLEEISDPTGENGPDLRFAS